MMAATIKAGKGRWSSHSPCRERGS
jgi:hypothetical protein